MDGEIVIGTRLDTKSFDAQISSLEKEIKQMEKAYETYSSGGAVRKEDIDDYQKLGVSIEKAKNKLIQLNQQKEKLNQPMTLSNEISSIGDGLSKTISKVGKWALAVFGVRSAYNAVRQAASTLAEYNDDLANKLQGIRLFMASALEPIVTALVNLVYKLMTYVNYLAKAWFGVDLFAKSTAMSMKSGVKSAQKMAKTLAGFDEMTVLNDNGTTGAAGGAGGGVEFPTPEDVPIPEWLQWIIDNKEVVVAGILAITAALLGLKLGVMGIMGLGIGIAIAGIIKLIKDIIDFIKDPSWDGFADILADLSIALAGVALAMIAFNATNPIGWIILLIAVIAMIVAAVIKNWDDIKEVLGKVWSWIDEHVIQPIWENIKNFIDTVLSLINTWSTMIGGIIYALVGIILAPFTSLITTIQDLFKGLWEIIVGIFNVIKGLFTGDMKTVLNGFKQIFKGVFDSLWAIVKYPLNLIIDAVNAIIGGINKVKIDVPSWVPVIGGQVFGFNIKKIPRLAKGTILNAPGKGVPVAGGTALAGEAGREAYLPLSDTQLLEELGSTIGKYITINANITNTMNGRVISRTLQQIQNENNFAYNS